MSSETPAEFNIRRLRLALADFYTEGVCEGVPLDQRVEAMIEFAAAGVSALPGYRPETLRRGVEIFISALRFLMPDVGVEFDVGHASMDAPPAEETH